MSDDLDSAVSRFATEHYGAFPLSIAEAGGATRDAIRHRVANGRWIRLYDEVYAIAGAPRTWRCDLAAACFAGGPRTVASHRSAAELWQLPGRNTAEVEITCPRWLRAKEVGLVVHESKALDDADVRIVDGIPATSPELTLLQLGAVCSPTVVEMAFDAAHRRELVTHDSVRALVRRLGARGRNGVGVLRKVVDDRAALAAIPESAMESRVLRTLRRLGLPEPVPQFEIRHEGRLVARVDFAYPDARVAIEYESYEHHVGNAALVRDTARRNALKRINWDVVGVTHDDLRNGGALVARTLSAVLARASQPVLAP